MARVKCVLICTTGLLLACGSVENDSSDMRRGAGGVAATGGAGTGGVGSGGVAATTGASASGGAGTDVDAGVAETGATPADGASGAPSDYDVLSTCSSEPCSERSFAQLIENSSQNINPPGVECVLRALRDRTPGRYRHETGHSFTSGAYGADHVIIVSTDGRVTYARKRYSTGTPMMGYPPEPAQRCQLKPESYFTACLAALDRPRMGPSMDPEAWACSYGSSAGGPPNLHWFDNCAEDSPAQCR